MADVTKKVVVLDFQVDTKDAVSSIANLTKANKDLREERKNLDLSTKDGKARIDEINKSLDANNQTIKENSSSLEKSRLNVGNYTGALDKLVPGLGSTVNGFLGMTKAALAFIATPIGLVLAAVAAAIALVGQYFTRTEAGADSFAKVMAQLGAIMNVILDRAAALGGALVKLFTGDFAGAADDAAAAVSGVGDEMEREAKLAGELADILDKLEDRELSNKVALSESTLEVKRLIVESKNRNLTEQQKIDLLNQATDLEVKSNQVTKAIALDKLTATTKQIELDFSQFGITKKKTESELEYAKRIVDDSRLTKAARETVANAMIELNSVEGDSLVLQEKIGNQIDAQNLKQEAKRQKLQDLADKEAALAVAEKLRIDDLAAKHAAAEQAMLDSTLDRLDKQLSAKVKFDSDLNKEQEDSDKEEQKQADANYQAELARQKKTVQITQDAEIAKQVAWQTSAQALGAVAKLFKQNSEEYKILASGEVIISTAQGVGRALSASAAPFIEPFATATRIASAIIIGVQGAAALARINGVQFETGGIVNGPRHSSGGVPILAEGGEVVFSRRDVAALGGVHAVNSMRPSYTDGGIIANGMTSSRGSQSQGENVTWNLSLKELNEKNTRIQKKVSITEI